MPEPLPRRSTECLCLVLPQCHWPSLIIDRSAFLMFRERDFPRVRFETAAISLCSGLTVCSPHRSLPPLQFPLQGGRDFYIRAKRASLPPHASDMLSVQLQAIDGTRTLTSPDSQPCRLLPIIAYAAPYRKLKEPLGVPVHVTCYVALPYLADFKASQTLGEGQRKSAQRDLATCLCR